jgi:hypothetical protein
MISILSKLLPVLAFSPVILHIPCVYNFNPFASSAMHSGGALRVHATAKGPPRPTESSGMPNPTREGATFLLEMLFSGPGFDGLGALFAEGKDGDGKEEGALNSAQIK